jgi:hypothetical protein
MKTIEEQWKTVEDFPDYEISNFGRCIRKDRKRILKKCRDREFYCYVLAPVHPEGVRHRSCKKSPGILVARAFVENPNGYKKIEYIDGNPTNYIFSNIRWVKALNIEKTHLKKNIIPREKQIKTLRSKIEIAERFEKALLNGKEMEFVYGEYKDICQYLVNSKCKSRETELKKEVVSFIVDGFAERVKRGYAPVSFEYCINMEISSFFRQYKKQLQTIELDERRI